MPPLKGQGENKENMYREKEADESSDSEERAGEGDDGELSTASEQSEDQPSTIQTRSSSTSADDREEEETGEPLDIGEHYMVRRSDGQWCKSRTPTVNSY
jgi:hypothetical protein